MITTPEEFKEACIILENMEWYACQETLNPEQAEQQRRLEEELDAAPFEFDEDGNVIART